MKRKLLIIIAAVVLLVGVGIGIGVAVYSNQPENIAIGAVQSALNDIVDREEIRPVYNMLQKGSLAVSVDEIKLENQDMLTGGRLEGKLYFSPDALMLRDAKITYKGIEADGNIYLSDKFFYAEEKSIVGGAYGAPLKDLADDLRGSIFAYGSGSEYAMTDEELYNTLVAALETSGNKALRRDAEKLLEKHSAKIWNIFCDNVDFEKESDDVRLNGEKTAVRVVRITIDDRAMANIITDLYEYLVEDESIPKFLDKYSDTLLPLMENAYGIRINDTDTLGEFYEETLANMADKVERHCDEIETSILPKSIIIEIITKKTSNDLLKLSVELSGYPSWSNFSIDFGKQGIKKTNEIRLTANYKNISYTVTENNKKAYTAIIKVDKTEFATVSIERSRGEYSIEWGDREDGYLIKGTIDSKRGKTSLTVDKVIRSYAEDATWLGFDVLEYRQDTYKTKISLVIDESDRMPSAPKRYDRITEITDADVKSWLDTLNKE